MGSSFTGLGPSGVSSWRLSVYTRSSRRVPRDLAELICRPIEDLRKKELDAFKEIPDLSSYIQKSILKDSEVTSWRLVFTYLLEKGHVHPLLASSGIILRLNGKQYKDMFELKVPNTQHNIRLILGNLGDRHLIILHAFSKKTNARIPKHHKDKALRRFKSMQ